MMLLSIFFWLLIGLSLVVCFALSEAYEYQPEVAVRTTLGISLLLAIFSGIPLTFLLRRYSPRILLRNVKDLSQPQAHTATAFRTICRKVGVADAELRISKVKLPISFVAEMGKPVVVISERLLSLLERDEIEAVLAHELAHVKNSDTALKAMVTAYRTALPHDPIIHLVEAAFHREREMLADQTAVKATGKPLSLASALLKIHEAFPRSNLRSYGTLSILGGGGGLMNRHPSITHRVNYLLGLAKMSPH
jgi:Zn-dependent protease with chaperone function